MPDTNITGRLLFPRANRFINKTLQNVSGVWETARYLRKRHPVSGISDTVLAGQTFDVTTSF
jgi:hypothetical protein